MCGASICKKHFTVCKYGSKVSSAYIMLVIVSTAMTIQCFYHFQCSSSGDLECVPLSQEDYNRAGYRGSVVSLEYHAPTVPDPNRVAISEACGVLLMVLLILGG